MYPLVQIAMRMDGWNPKFCSPCSKHIREGEKGGEKGGGGEKNESG